ncbi:shikimate kinase [Olivibacter sp. SDN3]|uniref:shikimate kinase n=1 Tax=Olivibacter sp. SDN3 TaxID=2764720 RepID=UPI00165163F4|nr:shikimate kinase [Olivibacter sp. SDN3]QNL50049.1 shikimate kinase [Olivibacter sp. SDN3]
MLTKHIFLVGFMGVGKTTNGKKLARILNSSFIDLDELFVQQEEMPITTYFEQHGETAFREREREILKSLHTIPPAVIATGGGAPCFFDNMDWMNTHGITVYLQMPAQALAQRLAASKKDKRPLIKHLDEDGILSLINERMLLRDPYYAKAHHYVNVLELDLEELAKKITARE